MQITNLSNTVQEFVVKGDPKDGVPPTKALQPGETDNIEVADPESGVLLGRVVGGAISIGGGDRKRRSTE